MAKALGYSTERRNKKKRNPGLRAAFPSAGLGVFVVLGGLV
jgi:hypothetical protein